MVIIQENAASCLVVKATKACLTPQLRVYRKGAQQLQECRLATDGLISSTKLFTRFTSGNISKTSP